MPTQCSADRFGFAPVERRAVVAGFDGGRMTSDAGALLLGATDRAIGLVERFAACFTDGRAATLIEHEVGTLVGQRVFGIALGYEDLIDHDQLRHDPTMAVLVGKLAARRGDCAPLAGKSTLNRLELGGPQQTRYHRIAWDAAKIEALFVELFREAYRDPPEQIILDLDATDDPLHGHQEGRFFQAITTAIAICRSSSSAERICWRQNSGPPTSTPPPARSRKSRASSVRSALAGRKCALCCAPIRGLPATR
jgi:DDE family transposase